MSVLNTCEFEKGSSLAQYAGKRRLRVGEDAAGEQSHSGEKDCARQRPVGGGYWKILSLVYKTGNGWMFRLCHR
jgi:hypothetical protein